MKRVIVSLLLAGAVVFGLSACGEKDVQVAEKNEVQEKVPEYKELTDPRGNTLVDTSTGESNPQIVETKYETEDVVVADFVPTEMGYAVDPTGETDSTEGLQKALYDCYYAGGGTVYLPAGNYAISNTIYVPPYVTLRGDWQDPDEGTEYGTIISVWMESEDTETAGAFNLGSCGGVNGLTVYYPLQSLDCIRPYPYTFYVNAADPNRRISCIYNVTVINGYKGIGTSVSSNHESMQIKNFKGTFLKYGLDLANSSDVGNYENIVINNKYWKEASANCMNAVLGSAIDAYTREYVTGVRLSGLEWDTLNNISVDGCAIGMHAVPHSRINFSASMYDLKITNCEQGLVLDALDECWGAVIARSYIEGGLIHNAGGTLKLCDVEIVGELSEDTKKKLVIDETDLSEDSIDYDKSYVKPASNLIVTDLPNGLFSDAGPELQKALDKMAERGGGVVYVPGGNYRFETPVTVPAGVELRGTSAVMTRDLNSVSNGTIFLCCYGDDASNKAEDQAFITLAGENAGLNGIRIIYPENSPKSEDINTSYTVRGTASGVYAVNSAISASAYGVDFSDCDNHYIEGVTTCCYYNAFRLGGTGGVLARCLQNGTVLVRTCTAGLVNWPTESEMFATLTDVILRKESKFVIVEDAKDQLVYQAFVYGSGGAYTNLNSENTFFNNIGSDDQGTTAPMLYVENGSVTGVNFLRSNGYSYELEKGSIELHNRMARYDNAEKVIIKEK